VLLIQCLCVSACVLLSYVLEDGPLFWYRMSFSVTSNISSQFLCQIVTLPLSHTNCLSFFLFFSSFRIQILPDVLDFFLSSMFLFILPSILPSFYICFLLFFPLHCSFYSAIFPQFFLIFLTIFHLFLLLPHFPASFHSYLTLLKMSPATEGGIYFGCVIWTDECYNITMLQYYTTLPSPGMLSSTRYFRSLLKTTKCDYYLCHVYLILCQHGTTRLLKDSFSLNLIFEDF
jgi:hypothetical protein